MRSVSRIPQYGMLIDCSRCEGSFFRVLDLNSAATPWKLPTSSRQRGEDPVDAHDFLFWHILTKYCANIISYHQTLATARPFRKNMASKFPRQDAFRFGVDPLLSFEFELFEGISQNFITCFFGIELKDVIMIWKYSKSIPTLEDRILWCNYCCGGIHEGHEGSTRWHFRSGS